jgi:hypothetical protein
LPKLEISAASAITASSSNFCGLDLSTQQSGQFRGTTKLSKYGNVRLRCAFWMAATIAVRQTENSFRDKFERYLRRDPFSADRKRMAYVAVAAKMARVAHGIIKTGTDFRCFHQAAAPNSGKRSTTNSSKSYRPELSGDTELSRAARQTHRGTP